MDATAPKNSNNLLIQVSLKTEKGTVTEVWPGQMVTNMLVTLPMVIEREKEHILGKMEIITREIIKIVNCMEKENWLGQMETYMKVISLKVKEMV